MEPFRLCDHIGRVICPVYGDIWHGKQIAVCNICIREHHLLHLLGRKFPQNLHAQVKVCRVKGIHHAFPVCPQPAVHPARQGRKEHQEHRHQAGACIAPFSCQNLTQRQRKRKPFFTDSKTHPSVWICVLSMKNTVFCCRFLSGFPADCRHRKDPVYLPETYAAKSSRHRQQKKEDCQAVQNRKSNGRQDTRGRDYHPANHLRYRNSQNHSQDDSCPRSDHILRHQLS